jgi:TnpA family transposase
MQMMYQLSTNKLTLQHSIKHKKVEDEIFKEQKWKKEKKPILKSLGYSKLTTPIKTTLDDKSKGLTALYKTVNKAIDEGENEYITIKKNKNGEDVWRLSPTPALADPEESLFAGLPQRSIVDIIRFVNQKTEFYRMFDPMLPRAFKGTSNIDAIMAAVLAIAIRVGVRKMGDISDLNASSLLSAEASHIRVDTLLATIDKINNEIAKLPIYKEWYINSILHGSLDGLKLGASKKNAKVRHSKKYFNDGVGVSGYNEIVNFLSVAGRIIGSNEYEGHYTFEMVYNQNTSEIRPKHISTDKHGVNALNFALFDFTDMVFAPRIPKPHKETLWGFGCAKDYEGMLIKPTHFIDEELFCREWDNIQRLVASILTGETSPSVIIRKLSSKNYTSETKKAFVQYNHIVRSKFILMYLHDYEFRSSIINALNRGELYNNLYRSIAILNNGELKGKSEIEMEIWNQCTRLIAAIMHYYNAYILNSFYINTKDKKEKALLAKKSPTAWGHINLLGYYQFCNGLDDKSAEKLIESWLQGCNWQKNTDFVEKNNVGIRATGPRSKLVKRLKH